MLSKACTSALASHRSRYCIGLTSTDVHLHLRCKMSSTLAKRCGQSLVEPRINDATFWRSRETWSRSMVNTFRCLVGCTVGDFSMMWWLQSTYPELGTITTMSLSMATGITTSIILETALLRLGRDKLPWNVALRTATGMSMISMLAMEATENGVEYSLIGSNVDLGSSYFWVAAGLATGAGFLVPLPYNYFRLRAYRKSCH